MKRRSTISKNPRIIDLRIAHFLQCRWMKDKNSTGEKGGDFWIIIEDDRAVIRSTECPNLSVVYDEVLLLGSDEIQLHRHTLRSSEMIQIKLRAKGRNRVYGKLKTRPTAMPMGQYKTSRVFSTLEIHFDSNLIPFLVRDPFTDKHEKALDVLFSQHPN